jgi:general secretion pathway protein M
MKFKPVVGTRVLAVLALLALGWQIGPAWQLWRNHTSLWDDLTKQRMGMLTAQKEALDLLQKPIPGPAEAVAQIQAISRQRFGAVPVNLPGATLQIQIRSLAADQLARGWNEIRTQTSASVIQADLTMGPQGWTGSLVFKLAQKP